MTTTCFFSNFLKAFVFLWFRLSHNCLSSNAWRFSKHSQFFKTRSRKNKKMFAMYRHFDSMSAASEWIALPLGQTGLKKGTSVKYTTLHAISLYKHHSLSSTVGRGLTTISLLRQDRLRASDCVLTEPRQDQSRLKATVAKSSRAKITWVVLAS
jgi:hypothetical protein